jgi:Coenzyme PQQ synthesis protein D (PqqD)
VSDDSRFVVSPDQVSCDLGGEAAILQLKSAIYYGLDPVGARVWELLRTPKTLAELRDAIVAEYEVDSETCERDLRGLLEKLASERLIEIRAEPSA